MLIKQPCEGKLWRTRHIGRFDLSYTTVKLFHFIPSYLPKKSTHSTHFITVTACFSTNFVKCWPSGGSGIMVLLTTPNIPIVSLSIALHSNY